MRKRSSQPKQTAKKNRGGRPRNAPEDRKENKSVNISVSDLARIEEAMEVVSEKKLGAFMRAGALEYAERILGQEDMLQQLVQAVGVMTQELKKLQGRVDSLQRGLEEIQERQVDASGESDEDALSVASSSGRKR